MGQRVGVDHGRHPSAERGARAASAAPGPLPEPTTHACTRPAPTTSGCASRTRSRRRRPVPDVADHPGTGRVAAPATESRAAPGYSFEPARMPTTPREYLWRRPRRHRQQSRRRRSGCSASTAGSGRSSPMSTRCTAPHAAAAGSTRCATLWVPKVTVTSAATWGPSSSPVSTSTPLRYVDGDDRDALQTGDRVASAVRAQAGAPADADDPVDDDVGAVPGCGLGARRPDHRRAAAP